MKRCLFFTFAVLSAVPVDGLPLLKKYSTRPQQEEFFKTYGYYDICLEVSESENGNKTYGRLDGDFLDPEQFADVTEEEVAERPLDPEEERFWRAVVCFQAKYSLRKTGLVNEATREMMELLAGGMNEAYPRRRKRYVTRGKWNPWRITYYIVNYDVDRDKTTMTNQEIRSEIQIAIKMWTDVMNLEVTEFNDTFANILIGFYPIDHNCDKRFTNELAHAFFPGSGYGFLNGDIHIRADVPYSAFSDQGKNLRYTVCHEFGHSIGLDHSNATGSIMNPKQRPYDPNQTLSDDDIRGVQSLYGLPGSKRPAPGIYKFIPKWMRGGMFGMFDWPTDNQ